MLMSVQNSSSSLLFSPEPPWAQQQRCGHTAKALVGKLRAFTHTCHHYTDLTPYNCWLIYVLIAVLFIWLAISSFGLGCPILTRAATAAAFSFNVAASFVAVP